MVPTSDAEDEKYQVNTNELGPGNKKCTRTNYLRRDGTPLPGQTCVGLYVLREVDIYPISL